MTGVIYSQIFLTDAYAEDPTVKALVDSYNDEVAASLEKVVGYSAQNLEWSTQLVRGQNSPIANLVTDALLDFFAIYEPDICLVNGGGIRASIPEGPVTLKSCNSVLPFDNDMMLVEASGATILAALENGVSALPSLHGKFAQPAGITYTADLTKEPGSRVSDVKFYDGTPLDPDARYKVVINSYLGGGGDGYTMLNVLDETKELASDVKIITHVNKTYMRQALQAYFEKSTEAEPIRVDMKETRIRLITEETFVNPFTDVAETDWFYDVVLQLAKNGIVNGMTETTFEPQGTLTRAEFATMLYRIAGTPAAEAESTYSDVKTGDWYYDAVVWATEAGVVNGMGDGTFAPNDNITRQEMATMLYRLAKAEKVEEDKLASFPDAASVADWAKDAMNWAVSTEIVNGSTHDDKVNYLDPTATALRCQAAAVACRYLALSK